MFRLKVKEENEGMSFGDIARKLCKMWKVLDAEDRGEYELQAAEVRINALLPTSLSTLPSLRLSLPFCSAVLLSPQHHH
jgi:hypothetical protein